MTDGTTPTHPDAERHCHPYNLLHEYVARAERKYVAASEVCRLARLIEPKTPEMEQALRAYHDAVMS